MDEAYFGAKLLGDGELCIKLETDSLPPDTDN